LPDIDRVARSDDTALTDNFRPSIAPDHRAGRSPRSTSTDQKSAQRSDGRISNHTRELRQNRREEKSTGSATGRATERFRSFGCAQPVLPAVLSPSAGAPLPEAPLPEAPLPEVTLPGVTPLLEVPGEPLLSAAPATPLPLLSAGPAMPLPEPEPTCDWG
jgi:hypothetical protein